MKPKKCRMCSNYEADEDGAVCTAEKVDGKRWCEVEPELNHNDKPSERYSK